MAVSDAYSSLRVPIDVKLGGVLLANMLAGWLEGNSNFSVTEEAADEPEDYGTPPEQTCLHLSAPVNAGASAPSSGEHGTPVCPAREGAGTGLERASDPHSRPGSGDVRSTSDGAGRLQDFKTLVAEVSMGQVGAVFALEVSRLARSNLDWHRLLELCALTETLVIDEDGCYNPADFNDGLLLGLKGTMAQAELHFLRVRLLAARGASKSIQDWTEVCR